MLVQVRFFSERLSWNSLYAAVDGLVRFGWGSCTASISMLFCRMRVKMDAGEKIRFMFHVAQVKLSLVFLVFLFVFLSCWFLWAFDFLFVLDDLVFMFLAVV